jgi:hypothetical protein
VASDEEKKQILKTQKLTMALIGSAVSAILVMPIIGLLAPSILGASACHFGLRRIEESRALAVK